MPSLKLGYIQVFPGLFVDGYSSFRTDRLYGVGGGTLLLVSNALAPVEVNATAHDGQDSFQDSTWCVIHCAKMQPVLIGSIYRSPSSSTDNNDNLNTLLSTMCARSEPYKIILGDFNFPDVNWDLMSGSSSSIKFRDTINDCFLTQLVHDFTRGSSILDIVLTNDPSIINSVEVIEPLLGSDHKAIRGTLRLEMHRSTGNRFSLPAFDYGQADWDLYSHILEEVNWEDMFCAGDSDGMWNFLKEKVLSTATAAIPNRSVVRKFCGVNVKGELKSAINARKKLFKRYRNCNKSYASSMLKNADERLRRALDESRAQHEYYIASHLKTSPRIFWKHVHQGLGSKPNIIAVESTDGHLITSDQEIAFEFDKFFASVFSAERLDNLLRLPDASPNFLKHVEFNECDILKILKALPSQSSAGPDGIPNLLLTKGRYILCPILKRLFQYLFDNGVLPLEWCRANITPIFKKGNRNHCSNYRPVSLTSTCCKVAEKVIKSSLLSFICKYDLLSSAQHGFLPRRSCLSSLLQFFDILTRSLDDGNCISTVYIDFAKAFDTVPHRRLLCKLRSLGIHGSLLSWVECFLCNRQQRVVIRGCASPWTPVLSGVPQGSVLGPLLFVIYVDDVDRCFLHSTVIKYADDVKIISEMTNDQSCDLLQQDLNRLAEWSRQWLLNINLNKCRILHFGSKVNFQNFFLGDSQLSCSSSERDLGVQVTSDLKPSSQCLYAAASAQKILNFIRLSFHYLDIHSLAQIYKAIIRPRLEYCIPAWCPYLQKDIHILEKVQRRMTRMIPHLRALSYQERLCHFKLSSLSTRRLRFDLIITFKIFNGLIDLPLDKFFTLAGSSVTRGHSLKLKVQFSRLSCRRFFFTNRVVEWWNRLPEECVSASSIGSFKLQLDRFFEVHTDLW